MNKTRFFLAVILTLAGTGGLANEARFPAPSLQVRIQEFSAPSIEIETVVEVVEMKNGLSLDGYEINLGDQFNPTQQNEILVNLPSSGYWSISPHPEKKMRSESGYGDDSACEAHSKRCEISYKSKIIVPYKLGQKNITLYQYNIFSSEWMIARKAVIELNPELIKELYKTKKQLEDEKDAQNQEYEKYLEKQEREEAITTAFSFIGIIIGLIAAYWIFSQNKTKFATQINNIGIIIRKTWNQAKYAKANLGKKKLESIAIDEAVRQVARNEVNRCQEEDQLKQAVIDAVSAGDMKKATELTQVLNSRFKPESQGRPTQDI